MTEDLSLFHFDDDKPSFEEEGRPNGVTLWTEEVLMRALGYSDARSFRNAVNRAKKACLTVGFQCEEHFRLQGDGSHLLTRFGCYLVAMNASSAKPQVAAAQAYFAALAQTFEDYAKHADGIDRLLIRDELTDGQKSLASTAKRHGVENYAFFQNQGYLGLYNMSLAKLCAFKGVENSGTKLMDRMGKAELAANLFRVTQTDERIKNKGLRGQRQLEEAAHSVGKSVRKTMLESSGTLPEELPLEEDIQQVRKTIKGTRRALDAPKRNSVKRIPKDK